MKMTMMMMMMMIIIIIIIIIIITIMYYFLEPPTLHEQTYKLKAMTVKVLVTPGCWW